MIPDFRITADSRDVTAAIRDRLLDLRVSDAAGTESDTLELRLDDRASALALPRTGAALEVELGYRRTGLAAMGRFVVDEIGIEGPSAVLTVRARSADLRQGLKSPKTRSWDNLTLGDLVAAIAAEHGYTPRVAASLAGRQIVHLDQTGESDLHLLTRLAEEAGAVAKPADGNLLFVVKGEGRSAAGKSLPSVALTRQDLTRWQVTIAERGRYGAVKAHWRDLAAGTEVAVQAGDGEPVFTLRNIYPDQAAALAAARTQLAASTRQVVTIRLSLPGDHRLVAESRIKLSGIRPGVDGEWSITRATHIYDGSGYRCELEGETPTE